MNVKRGDTAFRDATAEELAWLDEHVSALLDTFDGCGHSVMISALAAALGMVVADACFPNQPEWLDGMSTCIERAAKTRYMQLYTRHAPPAGNA